MAKHLRVLMVEDSEDDALLVIRELERGGYETTFERVETAEAMATVLEKQVWDIILVDYNLPHFSAPEALELFHQSGLDLPFIVISGTIGEETAVAIMKDGAHDYLMKGNLTRLVPAVERELHEAQGRKERKQAEEALQQSEEKYSTLVEQGNDGIVIIQDGLFKFVNSKMVEMIGFSLEEVLGKSFIDFVSPEYKELVMDRFKKRMSGEEIPSNYEITGLAKDGRKIPVEINASRIEYEGRFADMAIIRDITERKRTENAIKESEEKYSTLVQGSQDGIIIVQDEIIIFANRAMGEIAGYSEGELLGMHFLDIVASESKNIVATRYNDRLKGEQVEAIYEIKGISKDGSIKDVEISVQAIQYLGRPAVMGIIRDITQRKRAEEMLRESEEKFRTIADQNIMGIGILQDNVIKYINKAMADIYGYTVEEVLNWKPMEFFKIFTPETLEIAQEQAAKKQTGDPTQLVYYVVHGIHKTGKLIWADNFSRTISYEGHPADLITQVDITERKKMEEQLLINDRLASIGELVSGVAHELNNPLTGVIGFSDLLVGRKDLPDDVKEDIEIINREAQRTANIVKNLLTFARKQPKEKQATDINRAIQAVLELRAYEQKVSNLQVDTQFAHDLPEITANSFDLQQVFLNIIVNAEHAMLEAHGKGTITITTERDGDIIRASLADDGPGISEENLGHIFDPFFTTKEEGKGTGLGLSICYGTITEHGGKIYAESELGKGTTFIVELPVATTDNEEEK